MKTSRDLIKEVIQWLGDNLEGVIDGLEEAKYDLIDQHGEPWEIPDEYDRMIQGLQDLKLLQEKISRIENLRTSEEIEMKEQIEAKIKELMEKPPCPHCEGKGTIYTGGLLGSKNCDECNGLGHLGEPKKCDSCGGTGHQGGLLGEFICTDCMGKGEV